MPEHSPFVGRAWEATYLLRRLRHHRDVILTGPPGIGKSALSETVASAWDGRVELRRSNGERLELGTRRDRNPSLLIDDTGGGVEVSTAQSWDCTLRTVRTVDSAGPSDRRNEFPLRELFMEDAIELASRAVSDEPTAERYVLDMVRSGIPLSPLFVNAGLRLRSSQRALSDLSALFNYARADVLQDVLTAVDTEGTAIETWSGRALVGPDGRALRGADAKPLLARVRALTEELLRIVRDDPSQMHSLPSRQFEELVAELLSRQGFAVELTAPSRDGGRDIHAARHDQLGSFLYFVECKRYAPERPVGVDVVRQLLGVVHQARATAGIVATTSRFTREAKSFEATVRNQLSLRDFAAVRSWLAEPDPLSFDPRPKARVARRLMAPPAEATLGADIRDLRGVIPQVRVRPRIGGRTNLSAPFPGTVGWAGSWD